MSVQIVDGVIRIVGPAPVEDAEPLMVALLEDPARTIDLDQAGHLHSAVVQLLFALAPEIVGKPADAFFATSILPLLDRNRGRA